MKIIRESNQNIIQALGINQIDHSKNHRLLKYLIIEDVDGGKVIHNELTGGLIWIPNIQFDNIYYTDRSVGYIDWLWGNFFLVNEDYDEQSEQQRLKKLFRPNPENVNYLTPGHITEYTIFTTMACNARCAYCYEKGRPQIPMKAETAKKVGEYIIKTASKRGESINLRWFGGEPLVNENVIDIICKMVKDAGFNYNSGFTSNGFLFKKEKIQKYKDLWHLCSAQITIDGTEETYNKIKNYKNVKGKNPYQIVMDNIKMLLDEDMNIAIRMNMNQHNAENIKKLVEELYNKFGNYKKVSPYCYPIFDYSETRTDAENEEVYENLKEIDSLLLKYFPNHKHRFYGVRPTHCMIDHGSAVVIGTQGDVGLCEHYSEENFWGNINNTEIRDINMIKSFQEYMDDEEICKDCPILPTCLRPKKCEDLKICNIWKKEWHIREAHTEVLNMYNDNKIYVMNHPNEPIRCWEHEYSFRIFDDMKKENKFIKNDNIDEYHYKTGLAKFWENILILIGLK